MKIKRAAISDMLRTQLYWFPVAAVAGYHELGGLEPQKYIVLQFWRPEG